MIAPDEESLARQAMAAAVEMIARRDYTTQELVEKLRVRGFSAGICSKAVARCRQLGYLDDRRTAEGMAAALRRRGLGVHRIRGRLREKGIEADTIAALTDVDDDLQQAVAAARAVCERRRAHFERECDPLRRRAKIHRFLTARGFAADVIHRLLSEF
jgi:regulatory protein